MANIAQKHGRVLIGGLLCLAVFLHALIPLGFMPDYGQGKIALTICSGAGTQTVYVDADDAPEHHDDGAGDGPCAYYLAQAPGVLSAPPVVAALDAAAPLPAAVMPIFFRLARAATLPPPLRGPPAAILS